MPARRRMTLAEAAIIRRDLPHRNAREIAEHISALAALEGRPPVGVQWVYNRGRKLDVRPADARTAARRRFRPASDASTLSPEETEAGRVHLITGSIAAVAEAAGITPSGARLRVRRYYDTLGINGWQRHGPKPGTPRPDRAAVSA